MSDNSSLVWIWAVPMVIREGGALIRVARGGSFRGLFAVAEIYIHLIDAIALACIAFSDIHPMRSVAWSLVIALLFYRSLSVIVRRRWILVRNVTSRTFSREVNAVEDAECGHLYAALTREVTANRGVSLHEVVQQWPWILLKAVGLGTAILLLAEEWRTFVTEPTI